MHSSAEAAAADMGPSPEYLERCRKRMERIDRLPPELRQLVYEYGLTVVDAFLQQDINSPSTIRHLIDVVENRQSQGNTAPDLKPEASEHALKRLEQRFQVALSDQEVADIVDRIQHGFPKARLVARLSKQRTAWVVRHRGMDLGVVYDRKDKCLVTVMYAKWLTKQNGV